jgi:hypothetical protein
MMAVIFDKTRTAVPHMRRLSETTNQPIDLMVQIERDSFMTLHDVAPRFVRPQAPVGRTTHLSLTTTASKICGRLALRPRATQQADFRRPSLHFVTCAAAESTTWVRKAVWWF